MITLQSTLDLFPPLNLIQQPKLPPYTPTPPSSKFDTKFFITPRLSIHPDQLYLYGQITWVDNKPAPNKLQLANLLNNKSGLKLSDKAKKKARRAISYLLHCAKDKKVYNPTFNSWYRFKVNFITLSLSGRQQHSDKELKHHLLNQFLIEAKQKWGLKNYVWKAERQRNGNLHWHILSDVYIPWQDLRDVWNRLQAKLGYLQAYRKEYNKDSPNSTDVHSLRNVKNVPAYITKYMIKDNTEHRVQVSRKNLKDYVRPDGSCHSVTSGAKLWLSQQSNCGRIWACSQSLSNISGGVADLDNLINDEILRLSKESKARRIDKEHFTIVYYDAQLINATSYPILHALLNDYIDRLFPPEHYQAEY
jgi:hypothetical protein